MEFFVVVVLQIISVIGENMLFQAWISARALYSYLQYQHHVMILADFMSICKSTQSLVVPFCKTRHYRYAPVITVTRQSLPLRN